jgi:hypothetical protein
MAVTIEPTVNPHDRGGLLQLVHRDVQVAHDVVEHADDHVGVERAEQHRQAPGPDRDPAAFLGHIPQCGHQTG